MNRLLLVLVAVQVLVATSVLLQEQLVIWYNEPDRLEPRSLESSHAQSPTV
jgi:hypothetical protein